MLNIFGTLIFHPGVLVHQEDHRNQWPRSKDPPGRPADLPDIEDRLTGSSTAHPSMAVEPDDDSTAYSPDTLFNLTVEHPAVGVCLVVADGELDVLTVPLLERCLRDQLAAIPRHLVVDLQPVRFLGADGLACLLLARHLVQQSPGTHLYLSGLINRVVWRALDITGVLGLFNTYLTLTHAHAVLADTTVNLTDVPPTAASTGVGDDPTDDSPAPASGNVTAPRVLAAVWCSAAPTWTLELREVNPDDNFGALVDSISSGVPVSQPAPDALAQELVAARGLWLFCESPKSLRAGHRHHFGYVSIDTEP